MALRAIMIEVSSHVIWIVGLLEISCMALITIRVVQLIVTIDVTGLTRRRGVRPCQSEQCVAVVERRRLPHRGVVTLCAIMIEVSGHMVWIVGLLKLGRVARIAIRVL
jgi:hypothetical protein